MKISHDRLYPYKDKNEEEDDDELMDSNENNKKNINIFICI